MFERTARLALEIRKALLQAPDALLLVFRHPVERAQRVLNALHGADGIVSVEVRSVCARASDEEVRYRRGQFGPAEDVEAMECAQGADGEVGRSRKGGVDKGLGRFLARTFSGKGLLANRQAEVLAVMRVARRNVVVQVREGFRGVVDFSGKLRNCHRMLCCWLG